MVVYGIESNWQDYAQEGTDVYRFFAEKVVIPYKPIPDLEKVYQVTKPFYTSTLWPASQIGQMSLFSAFLTSTSF